MLVILNDIKDPITHLAECCLGGAGCDYSSHVVSCGVLSRALPTQLPGSPAVVTQLLSGTPRSLNSADGPGTV